MKTFLLIIYSTLILFGSLGAQDHHLKFRFANVKIDRSEATMKADIEVWSALPDMAVYAVNARFFYEADYLNFQSITDFQEGYGYVHQAPKPIIGGDKSAAKMFGSDGKAAYINTGIELKQPEAILQQEARKWVKLAQINFSLSTSALSRKSFCPILVWDRSMDDEKPSFLHGSVGAVATLIRKNLTGANECRSSSCSFENLNWQLNSSKGPYGTPTSGQSCITNGISLAKSVDGLTYEVRQNTPNPFAKETLIQFSLPQNEEVVLKVYDLNGRLISEQRDTYVAGDNQIQFDGSALAAGTYLYEIETVHFQSERLKMIKIGK